MQFLNPVTQNSERCPGTWSHPGEEKNKMKSLIYKGKGVCKLHKTL